ncbi:four-carbon acid sugar kinase family protein [Ilyobacter sp.]|uniref:four-carbon acid sugar kinase family protein n=1 Tax=Ilyobacter sp. TaxID=3100343 RepID=UPI00356A5341
MDKYVIIADDFTGANDTGVKFSKKSIKTIVTTRLEDFKKELEKCETLVIDLESRFDRKDIAFKKSYDVSRRLKSMGIKRIYKKIDSTFRGNIGSEIDGAMKGGDFETTFLIPALPNAMRTTENGNVFLNDILLEKTEISLDPRTPVKESFIPNILSIQSNKKVGLINYEEIEKGQIKSKIDKLLLENCEIIVFDSINDTHLNLIAFCIEKNFKNNNIMLAGSAGFAEKIPNIYDLIPKIPSALVIAGSISEVTRNQIIFFSEESKIKGIKVNVENLFNKNKSFEKIKIMKQVKEKYTKNEDILIYTTDKRDEVNELFSKIETSELNLEKISERIANFLGEITKDILEQFKVSGLFLTGGDTAIKVSSALKNEGIIIEREIVEGVPYGYFLDEKYKDMIVVSKAGAFGKKDAILKSIEFIKKESKKR